MSVFEAISQSIVQQIIWDVARSYWSFYCKYITERHWMCQWKNLTTGQYLMHLWRNLFVYFL